MSCEHYREALINAAATGEAIEGGLAEHLARCSGCRAMLEREQALFRAIDGALGGRVNRGPHQTFLPRLRHRIAHEAESRATSYPMWAWAGGAWALLLLAIAHPWTVLEQHPIERSLNPVAVQVPGRSTREYSTAAELVGRSSEIPGKRAPVRRHSSERSLAKPSAAREPEVLVPPDEAKAFRQFVTRLASGDRIAEAVARPAKDNTTAGNSELPEIRSFDVADLQLKPFEWTEWNEVLDSE